MAAVSLLVFLVLCQLVHAQSAEDDQSFPSSCPKSFHCGKLGNLSFPFTHEKQPFCGFFTVTDCDAAVQTIQLKLGSRFYEVESISQPGTIIINDTDLQESLYDKSCLYLEHFDFLWDNPFRSFHYQRNLTILKCNQSSPIPSSQTFLPVKCSSADSFKFYYSRQDNSSSSLGPPHCSIIQVPVNSIPPQGGDLFKFLPARFSLQVQIHKTCVQCHKEGGLCQFNSHGTSECGHFKPKERDDLRLILGLATSVAAVTAIFLITISVYLMRRKYSQGNSLVFWKRKRDNLKNIELFLQEFGSLCPKRFSYSDIKKITNSCRDKLGEGAFGGVYRGKLQGHRPVAVKILKGIEGNGEDFINEVSSISRTSHVNVVTLLGFCLEGHKRALIYEFMPNGSLEKFIYQNTSVNSDHQLKLETLYQIAIGVARGLEYLHRGCNTRILHFDIKPHNILLDKNFNPKISDFGLAKICPRRESIVSMVGARGTPGYIAPEVFSRNFGEVSHKSDVYSYGMMVLEMVGGRRNIECEADRTRELYFPHWVYKRLELSQELGLQGIVDDEAREQARKMVIVSMWCIQNDPSNRPPMSRVVEMLEGGVDFLQIPPKPFLSCPPRPPVVDSPFMLSSYSSVIGHGLSLHIITTSFHQLRFNEVYRVPYALLWR